MLIRSWHSWYHHTLQEVAVLTPRRTAMGHLSQHDDLAQSPSVLSRRACTTLVRPTKTNAIERVQNCHDLSCIITQPCHPLPQDCGGSLAQPSVQDFSPPCTCTSELRNSCLCCRSKQALCPRKLLATVRFLSLRPLVPQASASFWPVLGIQSTIGGVSEVGQGL